jgi:hypothetical protein
MLQVSIDPEDAKKAYYNNMTHLERRGAKQAKDQQEDGYGHQDTSVTMIRFSE